MYRKQLRTDMKNVQVNVNMPGHMRHIAASPFPSPSLLKMFNAKRRVSKH